MALHKLAVSGGVDVMSDLKDAMGESEICLAKLDLTGRFDYKS